ncbi:hypothetical protein [Candidatus Parabeggiatoa sp. HSG14]|uniref:Alvin_2107 family globule sulfur oxidation protein n=1 Tax=Candidatus Parabeggiatoa sp. HSG14 TaxID=3055593 RepID=UPI0025A7897F|nr:hypothetical protein [Thiotrichales bacterium HSG14]
MDQTYYNAVTEMEKKQVNREYVLGWMGGYLQNPGREEQRITEAYEAGYADGDTRNTNNFTQWVKK